MGLSFSAQWMQVWKFLAKIFPRKIVFDRRKNNQQVVPLFFCFTLKLRCQQLKIKGDSISLGILLGVVWEAYHKGVPLLGVPENPTKKRGWEPCNVYKILGASIPLVSVSEYVAAKMGSFLRNDRS